ncbi:hypothetical protein [Dictyobacter kobayashii]|uniref:Uncharacterized protein n=1 Tax=Dictyobacter kobayashii TaxID=2014872 RepID=A0A402AQL3_9CHLR|nr:hypothetical protein [Dictyobacter kobayashii]GCE21335.1 hypothetical protein KDK_51350 [Dictyobacter kobayashii]
MLSESTSDSTERAGQTLFSLARLGKRLPPWYVALVMCVVFLASIVLVYLILLLLQIEPFLHSWTISSDVRLQALSTLIQVGLEYAAVIGALALWVKLYERRPFWTIGFQRQGAWLKFGRGFLCGLLMFALAMGLLWLLGPPRLPWTLRDR